jgi:hypothetical protein
VVARQTIASIAPSSTTTRSSIRSRLGVSVVPQRHLGVHFRPVDVGDAERVPRRASQTNIVLAVAESYVPTLGRLPPAAVLTEEKRDYVEAARGRRLRRLGDHPAHRAKHFAAGAGPNDDRFGRCRAPGSRVYLIWGGDLSAAAFGG